MRKIRRIFAQSLAAIVFAGAPAQADDDTVHLIGAALPGGDFDMKDGEPVGAYVDFFREAAAAADVEVTFRDVPWARAVRTAEKSDHLLIFPLTRNAEREKRFTWLVPVQKEAMCLGSLTPPPSSLEAARAGRRVMVWRGSSPHAYLESLGFGNLVVIGSGERIAQVLASDSHALWYSSCHDIDGFTIKHKDRFKILKSRPVYFETVWLAGGKGYRSSPAAERFTKAVDSLREAGRLKQLMASSGG